MFKNLDGSLDKPEIAVVSLIVAFFIGMAVLLSCVGTKEDTNCRVKYGYGVTISGKYGYGQILKCDSDK